MPRMNSFRKSLLPALALSGAIMTPAFAQAPTPPPTPKGSQLQADTKIKLTLVPEKGLELTDASTGRIECGLVDPLTSPRIVRAFTIRNDTKQPITITRLKTSCGCESTAFLRDGKEQPLPEQQPAVLAPGEQAQVRVAVSLFGRQAYIKHASLWVYGQEAPEAMASVEIIAQIEPTVVFEPQILQFAKSTSGSTQTVQFSVAFDPRLVAPGKTWKITSSNPFVEAKEEKGEKQEKRGEKTVVVRSYQATLLATTPLGRVSGALTFTLEDKTAPKTDAAPVAISLPFMAERSGTFAAMPVTLLFGSVTAGKEYKRQILLSAASAKILQDAKITSDNRFLTVKAAATEGAASGAIQRLEVLLSDQTTAGVFTAHVTIESASGEKLIVPVIAQIEK